MARSLPFNLDECSVSMRAAIVLSAAVASFFVLAALLVFFDAREQALERALDQLERTNTEIVEDQQARFERIAAAHRSADAVFMGERGLVSESLAERRLGTLFPRRQDGSRRSADILFDGGGTPLGYLRGIGAFLSPEASRTSARTLVAATKTVFTVGAGAGSALESLYFFTPDNILIMYAPDRRDRLVYYRREAPADLDFQDQEFAEIVRPGANPAREMRCTSLRPILYDETRRTWTTGCMTPVDIDGRHVGSWGTSVPLDTLLADTDFGKARDPDVIFISREGRLIYHPDYTRQFDGSTGEFLDLEEAEEPRLKALWSFVRDHPDGYLGEIEPLDAYASIKRIPIPGWYALTLESRAAITAQAVRPLGRVTISAVICLAIIVVLTIFILRKQVGRPLRALARKSRELTDRIDGRQEASALEPVSSNEIVDLSANFSRMADHVWASHARLEEKVQQSTDELRKANAKLRRTAERDALTGADNRRKIMEELDFAMASASPAQPLSLILLDLDHFKRVNDAFGHPAGDAVLRTVAERWEAILRPNDRLGRIGGEEFMVLLPGGPAAVARTVAERLRCAVADAPIEAGETDIAVTTSLGVATIGAGDTADRLYERADQALYRAKQEGRDRVCSDTDISDRSVA